VAYFIQHITAIIGADPHVVDDREIWHLLTDSRKIVFPESSLFFALGGERRNGHQYIAELYDRGVQNFVVSQPVDYTAYPKANFLHVKDVLTALQQLAAYHRGRFHFPVIGITGSNGKTIVKEWLYQLLAKDHAIVRSPRSYNSQIGVPLSIWQMQAQHTLGIFEAGISTRDEMEKLASIIQPTAGILTNIGDAHNEGFANHREKALEKIKLFAKAGSLIYCPESVQPYLDPAGADKTLLAPAIALFSWSRKTDAAFHVLSEKKEPQHTLLTAGYAGKDLAFQIPFTDRISIDNVISCICVLLQMGYDAVTINERIQQLQPMDMRMQLKKAINNSYLVNDSYSNDTASLELAMDYLLQQSGNKHTTLILSDILQSGQDEAKLYQSIAEQLKARGIGRLIGIGPGISRYGKLFTQEGIPTTLYPSTGAFLQQAGTQQFRDEYILLKGARVFEFEKISHWLEQKVHQTVMEINLSAMARNLKTYQQHLRPSTKMMAMVKAFSYGSGSAEVASVLQFHKVDWLAVAYADEGVELRKAGISLPIMVMNADEAGFDALVNYGLEPEIYSFTLYHAFHAYLGQQGIQGFPVHIKFNTGMNRLGFEVDEAGELGKLLHRNTTMAVRSVFSHLAASEAAEHDAFTAHQVGIFREACTTLKKTLGYDFIRHIANSAAIIRNPDYQFDMVRLGIGLYGVDSVSADSLPLATVTVLRSTIAQVRTVKAGETVGYSRKGIVQRDSRIATVRIGYADGYSRRLGNGRGRMFVNGKLAPVIGSVCMDMTMIDITDIPGVKEGEMVEIFGENLPVQDLAVWADTIPYEILTGISQRVKRVYWEE
jgi:alanine racemase